jgi:hypothetical protein
MQLLNEYTKKIKVPVTLFDKGIADATPFVNR